MFDNSITLNPNSQLTGVTGVNSILDRITLSEDGSLWRVPGTAISNPNTLVVKHDVRQGKGYKYQASSLKHSFVLNDTVSLSKAQFDIGFYLNVPQGTFLNTESTIKDAVARLIGLIRTDGVVNRLLNMES